MNLCITVLLLGLLTHCLLTGGRSVSYRAGVQNEGDDSIDDGNDDGNDVLQLEKYSLHRKRDSTEDDIDDNDDAYNDKNNRDVDSEYLNTQLRREMIGTDDENDDDDDMDLELENLQFQKKRDNITPGKQAAHNTTPAPGDKKSLTSSKPLPLQALVNQTAKIVGPTQNTQETKQSQPQQNPQQKSQQQQGKQQQNVQQQQKQQPQQQQQLQQQQPQQPQQQQHQPQQQQSGQKQQQQQPPPPQQQQQTPQQQQQPQQNASKIENTTDANKLLTHVKFLNVLKELKTDIAKLINFVPRVTISKISDDNVQEKKTPKSREKSKEEHGHKSRKRKEKGKTRTSKKQKSNEEKKHKSERQNKSKPKKESKQPETRKNDVPKKRNHSEGPKNELSTEKMSVKSDTRKNEQPKTQKKAQTFERENELSKRRKDKEPKMERNEESKKEKKNEQKARTNESSKKHRTKESKFQEEDVPRTRNHKESKMRKDEPTKMRKDEALKMENNEQRKMTKEGDAEVRKNEQKYVKSNIKKVQDQPNKKASEIDANALKKETNGKKDPMKSKLNNPETIRGMENVKGEIKQTSRKELSKNQREGLNVSPKDQRKSSISAAEKPKEMSLTKKKNIEVKAMEAKVPQRKSESLEKGPKIQNTKDDQPQQMKDRGNKNHGPAQSGNKKVEKHPQRTNNEGNTKISPTEPKTVSKQKEGKDEKKLKQYQITKILTTQDKSGKNANSQTMKAQQRHNSKNFMSPSEDTDKKGDKTEKKVTTHNGASGPGKKESGHASKTRNKQSEKYRMIKQFLNLLKKKRKRFRI